MRLSAALLFFVVSASTLPRLQFSEDRECFARWFTFLAEAQYFTPPAQRSPEITDCSALLRYCYREALRKHDAAWAAQCGLRLVPALGSVREFNYPRGPLGTNLFELPGGRFGQFADAHTLQRYNTMFAGRDFTLAHPGDLLFYRREGQPPVFHSMIFIGRSQIAPSQEQYVVYDTGPDGAKSGEMKRLTMRELLMFPDATWQPKLTNPHFLGVFRWNLLRDFS